MGGPVFGLTFTRQDDQSIPVVASNLDVVGLIGPCSTADPSKFPLNTPVLVFSNDTVALAGLYNGVDAFGNPITDGYLVDALNGINAQLADDEVAAQVIIVRTAYGSSGNAALKLQQTIANIMGSSVARTGVWAFLKAPSMLYCTPRLIMAPGYTGLMANSLDTLTSNVQGVGYIPNETYQVTFTLGGSETNGAQVILPIAHAVADAFGNINDGSLVIDSFGAWMTDHPGATLPAADGPAIVALAATGELIFSAQPGVGSTLNLNGSTVSFVSGAPSGLQVQLGANLAATMTALQTFLAASSDTQIVKNTYATTDATVVITNKTPGAAGNAYTLGGTVTGLSLSGTTLSGGQDAASAVNATLNTTIALGANPIVAALSGGVLDGLMAHAVVESAGTSLVADENWRNTINSKRIIPLSGGVKVLDVNGNIVVMPLAPRIIGEIIARDFETGFPFHSAANRPVNGIVGPARTIDFSLTDGATEGQVLLAANIGIVVRGNVGVETAISSGGFNYVGTDTCSDDPLWTFYNVTRGRDFIELSLMPALRAYLGRNNIDRQTVTAVIGSIEAFLSQLTALQQILGYSVQFQGTLNSAAEIRLGHIVVSFAAEEPPVLRRINVMSARYAPAIDALVASLAQELNFNG
jgi:phage tail sheath protein FI